MSLRQENWPSFLPLPILQHSAPSHTHLRAQGGLAQGTKLVIYSFSWAHPNLQVPNQVLHACSKLWVWRVHSETGPVTDPHQVDWAPLETQKCALHVAPCIPVLPHTEASMPGAPSYTQTCGSNISVPQGVLSPVLPILTLGSHKVALP